MARHRVGARLLQPGGRLPSTPSPAAPGAGDQRHRPQVPKVTNGSLYRTWRRCHDGAIEPSTVTRLGRHDRRQEGTPMDPGTPTILIVAMIAGPFLLLLGVSWLFNGRWPWRRPRNGSDEIDQERSRNTGFLGRFFGGVGGGGT
jgi:hypothetical protein